MKNPALNLYHRFSFPFVIYRYFSLAVLRGLHIDNNDLLFGHVKINEVRLGLLDIVELDITRRFLVKDPFFNSDQVPVRRKSRFIYLFLGFKTGRCSSLVGLVNNELVV